MNHTSQTPDSPPNASSRVSGNSLARTVSRWIRTAFVLLVPFLVASDHADPFDPFNKGPLEPGITDLFVFPVTADGRVAFPFERKDGISLAKPNVDPRTALTADEQSEIKGLVVILCVRRALTERGSLQLEPYTYRIHMDNYSPVDFGDSDEDKKGAYSPAGPGGGYQPPVKDPEHLTGQEARARYGGRVGNPEGISANVTIELRLNNDTSLKGPPVITGLKYANKIEVYDDSREVLKDNEKIVVHTGVHDDPFIFPAFFGTNVVAMVLRIPMSCFPDDRKDWLVWASSHKGGKQIDHVGRSLRTQNPRFEILNTLHPKDHVAAIRKENKNPSFKRDVGLRLTLQQLAAYRRWDFVPDVIIYSKRFPVGFPNGRVISDDVASLLAQHGDTLLLELSHQHPKGGWPRRTTNDMPFFNTTEAEPFRAEFPYLAKPWPDSPAPAPPSLSARNQAKLTGLAVAALVVLIAVILLFARWYHRKKLRQRYL